MPQISTRTLALICLTAALGFLLYIALAGLATTGRHLVVISVVRAGLLAGVFAAVLALDLHGRLVSAGLVSAAVGAVLNVVGSVSHVVTDGWAFDPFVGGGAPPWYSFVIGVSAILFAAGTLLVGVAALRRHSPRVPAVTVVLAGLLYVLAIPLGAAGHVLWTLPWLGLGGWLLTNVASPAPAEELDSGARTS